MGDVFSETSRQGFGQRLKGAIGGIIVGLVMFVAAFPLQWINEGRSVARQESLAEGAAAVVSTTSERVDPANEGKLVHLAGRVSAPEPLVDPDFGISANALALERRVEMYQWKEKKDKQERKKLGGGTETVTEYRYSLDWDDDTIDSGSFRHAEGHANPGAWPIRKRTISADHAKLGAFTLGKDLTQRFDDWQRLDVPADAVFTAEGFRRIDAGFYRGADPASPKVGDVRVRFVQVPEGDYSFVARQAGEGLDAYVTSRKNEILLVERGTKDAKAMFAHALDANARLTWLLRGAGFAAMWLGLFLMLRPLAVLGDIVPFLGGLLAKGLGIVAFALAACFSLLTIGLAWLAHRPVLGISLLVLGAAAIFWLRRRSPRTAETQFASPPPPPPGALSPTAATLPPPPPAP